MRWYVIYDADFFEFATGTDIDHVKPKTGEWTETEGDEQYQAPTDSEEYENGQHRKWTALLSDEDWEAVCVDQIIDLDDDTLEPTMGSITELGHLPAFAMNWDGMDWNVGGVTPVIFAQMYVSPLPETNDDLKLANELLGEEAWVKAISNFDAPTEANAND